jgi:hypothetical protein
MQYVIYFAVATPLVLGWLFWAADRPPLPPLFNSGIDNLHVQQVPPARATVAPGAPKRLARDTPAARNE